MTGGGSGEMTGRERVLTALDHREPDRTPFAWGFGPNRQIRAELDAVLGEFGVDFAAVRAASEDIVRGTWAPLRTAPPELTSIWGFTNKRVTNAMGGVYEELDHLPLAGARGVDDMHAHPWPDPDDRDYSAVRERIRTADPDRRRAVLGGPANPLEIFMWLSGLENTLIWLVTEPEMVRAGLRHITDYFLACARRTLEAADGMIDLWFCADDLGGQHGPLFAPAVYRDVVQPFHREVFSLLHEFGVKVLYHSDGSCAAMLDDLIDAGIDCLEAVQVECRDMAPESLAERFAARVSFHGAISVQQLLPRATPDEVRAEVARLKRVLGAGGGYVAAPSHAIQDGTPVENVLAMLAEATGRTAEDWARAARGAA